MGAQASTAAHDAAGSPVSPCRSELVQRAASIASGTTRRRGDLAVSREVARRIDRAERRALGLARAAGGADDGHGVAALEFLAETVTVLVLDRSIAPGEASQLVAEAAEAIGVDRCAAALTVFMRALGSTDAAQLPPHLAIDFILDLVVELGPAEAVSLFSLDGASRRLVCMASSGEAATSRRLRFAARSILDLGFFAPDDDSHVRAVAVTRWDQPFAALVGRGRPEAGDRLSAYLAEAASALSPLLERELLFDRNAARERELVSAGERRLLRLGCDLHDGPLQEIVAFAEDIRFAREQVGSLVDGADAARVRGRFDDLEARLASLDDGLRDISHAVRTNNAVEQPLEHVLRQEVDAFVRATGVGTELAVDGDVSALTASQKIALFRVVQEALGNTRKHGDAQHARVHLRSTRGYVTAVISDDGRGFDVEAAKTNGRLGLTGLVERVRLLGGDVDIESSPGAGVRVRATLPQWRPSAEPETSIYAVVV